MTTKTFARGDVVDYTNAGSAITAGSLVKMSHTVGVALTDIATNATGAVAIEGVFAATKVSGTALAAGEKLVYKTATNSFNGSGTSVVTGDITGAAVAVLPALSADTVAYVKLTPGNTTLT